VRDKPRLDLTAPIGRGFIALLTALAEDERQRIVKRTRKQSGAWPLARAPAQSQGHSPCATVTRLRAGT
jgi:hypothetical protein